MSNVIIEKENLFRTALQSGVNLFAGSGFSVMAKNGSGRPLPLGAELAAELVTHFELRDADALSLPQICSIIQADRDSELDAYLRKRFDVATYDSLYDVIPVLNIPAVLTTNIDNLFTKIFEKCRQKYIQDLVASGAVLSDRQAVEYVPVHGNVEHVGEPLSFSTLDIAGSFADDPDKWHFLTERLQKRPTLFWGYSLADAGVLQALHPRTTHGRPHQQKWIVLLPGNTATESYFRSLGFFIINATTEDLLRYASGIKILDAAEQTAVSRRTEDLFPYECVPTSHKGPVRPVAEFYMGAEPTWHDVFSGQVGRTHHFGTVLDAILSKKHVIVVGVPACGKSTLMLQLAVALSVEGHKLITSSMTVAKAALILKKLANDSAVVFLDNFGDSVDAYSVLTGSPNVQVVGFDREYNYEIASHRIERHGTIVIDVTELTTADIQDVFRRIPDRIRSPMMNTPEMEAGLPPSLYEVVERNVVGPTLRKRFATVLQQLQDQGNAIHDLFLMCCYVHSCRTPVSLDMAIAFLRDDVSSITDVATIISKLGGLIADYAGNLIDSEQDHFVPRSTLVSEAVLDASGGSALRRVITKFHRNVSTLRICRYDIFKKRAYDADLTQKAFPNWEEGEAFYQSVYDRLQSPYILQQGALYLAHKHQFREAFTWIDKAVTDTSRRVLSIRNSHAIILFRANISVAGDSPTRHATLKQSMEILAECHKFDRRKTYHAMVFADQALQYWDAFGNDEGLKYLETARQWLASEQRTAPWNRRVQRLVRVVNDRLQQINT